MNPVINPDFLFLEDFIQEIPDLFEKEGRTIYKARNELKVFQRGGVELNVKSYRTPSLVKRILYTYLRKSKARRAYENALEVLNRGFDTPQPVGYMELRKCGLLERSFFISLQCPYTRMFREFGDQPDVRGREDILEALGVYVANLHQAGILHLDLSVGNILFEKDETGIKFSLIDINRMKFCSIDQKTGCKNFERLRGSTDFFRVLATSYAKACGYKPETCLKWMLHYNFKSVEYFRRKREFKQRFRR